MKTTHLNGGIAHSAQSGPCDFSLVDVTGQEWWCSHSTVETTSGISINLTHLHSPKPYCSFILKQAALSPRELTEYKLPDSTEEIYDPINKLLF